VRSVWLSHGPWTALLANLLPSLDPTTIFTTIITIQNSCKCSHFIITCHTLVWQDNKFAVFFIFLCPVTDISATVAPIGVNFGMMDTYQPGQVFFPFGVVPPRDPPNPKFWAYIFAIWPRISRKKGKSQRYICWQLLEHFNVPLCHIIQCLL